MKAILLVVFSCAVLALSGCVHDGSYQVARRSPVWVLPVTETGSSTTPATPVAPTPDGNQPLPLPVNPSNPATSGQTSDAPPPVSNVLSLEEIRAMTVKGVGEATILTALRGARTIYTLTSKDVKEMQEAGVSQAVLDYLLSTPLLYRDDLIRYRAYYQYVPYRPGYWHWSFHDIHHDLHHYSSHHAYGHDVHHGIGHH